MHEEDGDDDDIDEDVAMFQGISGLCDEHFDKDCDVMLSMMVKMITIMMVVMMTMMMMTMMMLTNVQIRSGGSVASVQADKSTDSSEVLHNISVE